MHGDYELPAVQPRGVYVTRYRRNGQPMLAVIDRLGELRALRPLPPTWDLFDGIAALAHWLDIKDPNPELRLVVDGAGESENVPAASQRTVPVVPPELRMTRAQAEITFGWRRRRSSPPPRHKPWRPA